MTMKTKQETQVKPMDAGIVEAVLAEIADERKAAHEALRAAEADVMKCVEAVNEGARSVVLALQEAEADVKAHARFEKRMPRAAYDVRLRDLNAVLEACRAKHAAASKDANEKITPLRAASEAAMAKCRDLAREWTSHLRFAKAAGVNVEAYWTPEAK